MNRHDLLKPRKLHRHRGGSAKSVRLKPKTKASWRPQHRRVKGLPLKSKLITTYDSSSPLLAMKIRRIARKLANDPEEAEDIAFAEALGADVALDE